MARKTSPSTTNSQAPWMIWAKTAKLWNVVKTTSATSGEGGQPALSRRMPSTATRRRRRRTTATLTPACAQSASVDLVGVGARCPTAPAGRRRPRRASATSGSRRAVPRGAARRPTSATPRPGPVPATQPGSRRSRRGRRTAGGREQAGQAEGGTDLTPGGGELGSRPVVQRRGDDGQHGAGDQQREHHAEAAAAVLARTCQTNHTRLGARCRRPAA